ncbi:MAG TPA: DUF1570 domain-containing protein, partial [Planctomycetota bacterium]|nr:DUF1570 domain-containing protein [Planctomycetota bacterium]
LAVLAEHGPVTYVLSRRRELLADLQRCDYQCDVPAPDARQLVGGELLAFDRRTGDVRLRYRGDQLGDFERHQVAGQPDLLVHPLRFVGPHTVTLSGRSYPDGDTTGRMLVCVGEGSSLDLLFGTAGGSGSRRWPAVVQWVRNGRGEVLAQKDDAPFVPGAPFTLVARVGAGEIELGDGRTSLLRAPRRGEFGRVAVFAVPFDTLLLEGRTDLAWLKAKEDEQRQLDFAGFARRWQPGAAVPAWLVSGVEVAAALPSAPPAPAAETQHRTGSQSLPGVVPRAEWPQVATAIAALDAGDGQRCLDLLSAPAAQRLPAPTREYLRSVALVLLRHWRLALPGLDRTCAAAPEFVDAFRWRATVLEHLHRPADAERDYRVTLAAQPADPAAVALALLYLRAGDGARARQVTDTAASSGASGEQLAGIQRMLAMAAQGPNWPRTAEFVSRHYRVRTDLDTAAAARVADVLESVQVAYGRALGSGSERRAPFTVYLFAGKAGYSAYLRDIVGELQVHTAGVYCPTLQQLLVYNHANPAIMRATVQHEGFHQYLDSIGGDVPPWLNEGLAVYFETCVVTNGRLGAAPMRSEHLATLRARGQVALAEFVQRDAGAFYGDAERSYAEAWALVYWLRHGQDAPPGLFERLFAACRTEPDALAVITTGFAGQDLGALDAAFRQFVATAGSNPAPR